jgi:hypothetical protein
MIALIAIKKIVQQLDIMNIPVEKKTFGRISTLVNIYYY